METNDNCDSYCYNAIKPLLEIAAETKNKIENCDTVILSKNEKIEKLEEKIIELQANASIFKQLEALYIEKVKYKDDLITALEQKTCPNNIDDNQIASLKAQIEDNTAAVKVLKTQLSSLNSSILVQIYNAKQTNAAKIQEIPINCIPFENSTGIHEISVAGIGKFEVLCDGQTAGAGWTVVQRRFDGSENFYRDWSAYRDGFGNLKGEFFMGLEKLHQMTKSQPYELYVELTDFRGEVRHARYDNFHIGSEEEKFMLKSLGTYSGNAGDALHYNLHDQFTTFDRDNDNWEAIAQSTIQVARGTDFSEIGKGIQLKLKIVKVYLNSSISLSICSNLNGQYFDNEVHNEKSIWWYNWKGYRALRTVKMMIRPRYSSF